MDPSLLFLKVIRLTCSLEEPSLFVPAEIAEMESKVRS
jgi:hypothetical protein